MRKFLYLITAICSTVLCINSCECTKKVNTVEDTITKNMAWMNEYCGSDYVWYETEVVYNNYLDEETNGSYETINSVFYHAEIIDSTSFEPVTAIFITKDWITEEPELHNSPWVGDEKMYRNMITLTFVDAFDAVMACNYPKPHSKHCVLRKELGPRDCNPQYIFGNTHAQLYVDAKTGEVTDENPVYKGYNE